MEITETKQNATSPGNHPVLPDAYIDRLFERLACMYGRKFADLWGGIDPLAVRKTWAEDLGRYPGEVIAKALTVCRDTKPFPPTLPEFILLCKAENNRPQVFKALPSPPIDRKAAKQRLAEIMRTVKERSAA